MFMVIFLAILFTNYVLVADLDEKWVVDPDKFVSKGKNTPFTGYELEGVVKYTIVDGEVKYRA